MRRSLTDLGGRIATCCTASEAGLVVILPDNITGQEAGVEAGVVLDGGARAEDVDGMEDSVVDEDWLIWLGELQP